MLRRLYLNSKLVIVSLFIISSICSLLTSNFAHASSDFDAVFSPTSTTHVSGTYGSHTCSSQDISTSWGNILQTESYWSHSVGQSYATTKSAFQAALANGDGWAVQEREFLVGASVGNYTWNLGDKATQITFTADDSNFVDFKIVGGRKFAIMHADSAPVYTVIIGQYWDSGSNSCSIGVAVSRAQYANSTDQQYVSEEMYVGHDNTDDAYNWDFRQLLVNSPVSYPESPTIYEGEHPVTLDSSDTDGDLLAKGYEVAQGTSDNDTDTDGDGIDDFKESVWYGDRADVFCGSSECTYPDPIRKDLYVEVDWMKNPSTNESYKPTATQLTSVVNAYLTHGIHAHFDTGQYGGGNELPTYVSELEFVPDSEDPDFFNIKNGDGVSDPNFSSMRRGVWHYMITGYKTYVKGTNASTGASYPGDDDALIAIGRVKELVPTGQDTAIAGTIMHELGHNLCLSDDAYTGQDSSCLFSGVDTHAGNDYLSSMNYDKQLSMVDYSEGTSGVSDHDDWSAVLVGMDDFVTNGQDPTESFARGNVPFNKKVEN